MIVILRHSGIQCRWVASCEQALPSAPSPQPRAGWVVASESRPSQPFALYAAHLPERELSEPAAQAWGWTALPLPDAGADGWPAAVRAALADVAATVLQAGIL